MESMLVSINSAKKYPLIFVMGAPRSGTTLLNAVLNTHPRVSITNEVNFVRCYASLKRTFFRPRSDGKRARSPRETLGEESVTGLIPQSSSALPAMFRSFCLDISEEEPEIIGDKLPLYYRENFDELVEDSLFSLKAIYVTRDPLGVVSSMLRRSRNAKLGLDYWRGPSTVQEAASEWVEAWNKREKISGIFRGNMLDLNYEAYIRNPLDGNKRLAEFLEVDNLFSSALISSAPASTEISYEILRDAFIEFPSFLADWASLPIELSGLYDYVSVRQRLRSRVAGKIASLRTCWRLKV